MRIGVDIDGVLANYIESYARRLVHLTGRNLFPPEWTWQTWDYDKDLGYTSEERARTRATRDDGTFWYSLNAYPETGAAMVYLSDRMEKHSDDVYFITDRPGRDAKRQTELWLHKEFGKATARHHVPTVLITPHKGMAARTLDLDVYVDDKWENCLSVAASNWQRSDQSNPKVFLFDRPWNGDYPLAESEEMREVVRVSSICGICDPAVTPPVTPPCRHAS